jgi:hypothetical protein
MDVLFEACEVIIVFEHASEDIIELPHVALQVGRQRDRRADILECFPQYVVIGSCFPATRVSVSRSKPLPENSF